MCRNIRLLFAGLFIVLAGQVVQAQDPSLAPNKPVERTIVGGESHTYPISLAAGQFMRVFVEQRGINVQVALSSPDGKPIVESDLIFNQALTEPVSFEASAAGTYRLVVRSTRPASDTGKYEIRLDIRSTASSSDRQRINAEMMLHEARGLILQRKYTEPVLKEKLTQALASFRELQDRYLEGMTLENLAILYRVVDKNMEKASEAYEQMLVIDRELKNRSSEGYTLNSLGLLNDRWGRPEEAIEYFEQARPLFRELKDRRGEALALGNLSSVYFRLPGRNDKAIEHSEQMLSIFTDLKDLEGQATALLGLSNFHIMLGNAEKSVESQERGLAIYRELKNRKMEGTALRQICAGYINLSRPEKAIENCEQALAISREFKQRSEEGSSLNNLGLAYSIVGRLDDAIRYYEESLAISRETKDRVNERYVLSSLGSAYEQLESFEKAAEIYDQTLAIARELKNSSFEASALAGLGSVAANSNRYEKAIEYYEQSLTIYRELKERLYVGGTLAGLGDAYRKWGRIEKGVEYLQQGLAIYREVQYRAGEADVLKTLAQAEITRGDLGAARKYIEEGLKVEEARRSDIISQESRTSFLAGAQGTYRLYTDILMSQHKTDPSKGLNILAFETSERQRSRSLLDLLGEARADIRQGVDESFLESERKLLRKINDKAQLLMRAKSPEQADALKKEISQLENDYERAQAAIRRASPNYSALTQPQPLKLGDIQSQLDADTLLLEYSLGEERSYLWVIGRDSLASYELPKRELIEKSAREVYELLTARNTNRSGETAQQRQERLSQAETKLPAAALELSKMILAPVAAQIGTKRLLIVADGALQYIPFAMLPDPALTAVQPLIVGHEVVSLPSASVLALQRSELANRQPAPKMLAVIADPVFDRSDARFKMAVVDEKAAVPSGMTADTRGLEHIAETKDAKTGKLVIRRLPFTRQEADAIIALTPKDSSFKAIDFQANRTNVLNGDLSQYKYVHFATHGVMDAQRPGLSSLVLSTVDAAGKPQNGFLRANDIYNMKLPAELVVLSACQTGLGKEVKGEGLIGLTRGFMYAGAKRVVVSLWSVNDKATSDLMTKFYRGMLKDNERPAAALRAAQIEMWKQKKWQSPYYWAAFTMQGEWK